MTLQLHGKTQRFMSIPRATTHFSTVSTMSVVCTCNPQTHIHPREGVQNQHEETPEEKQNSFPSLSPPLVMMRAYGSTPRKRGVSVPRTVMSDGVLARSLAHFSPIDPHSTTQPPTIYPGWRCRCGSVSRRFSRKVSAAQGVALSSLRASRGFVTGVVGRGCVGVGDTKYTMGLCSGDQTQLSAMWG